MSQCIASVAVVGAGDYIGSAIARRFAREGYHVVAGRRNGDKLAPLVAEIEAPAAFAAAFHWTLARKTRSPISCAWRTRRRRWKWRCLTSAPTSISAAGNHRAGIPKSLGASLLRGFLTGREASRRMLPRGRGSIFFTGATASVRGGKGYAAFASAKFGLRASLKAWRGNSAREHPRCASGDRCRRRYRMGAPADRRGW